MPCADPKSPWCVNDPDRAHQIVEVSQRLAHAHEHDVVDVFAALALNRHDLVDNLIGFQVPAESFQPARAKLAAVGATDLGRNSKRPPVRARSVKRRRRGNQNRFDQVSVGQPKKEFPCRVARAERADDVDLAESKFLTESVSKLARQIRHRIERLDAFLVEPIDDLAHAISRLAEVADFRLQFLKLKRLDVDPGHRETYGVGASLSIGRDFLWRKVRCWLGFGTNEISRDVSHSIGGDLFQRLRFERYRHGKGRSGSGRSKKRRGKPPPAGSWRWSERKYEVVIRRFG